MVSDEDYLDEIFMRIGKKKIWPEKSKYERLKIGETEMNITVPDENGGKVDIDLWDWDILSKNDLLGTFHLDLSGSRGVFSTELTPNGKTNARYALHWEYF